MPLYQASIKRSEVEIIIADTAKAHAVTDFAFNLAGFVPLPGMGFVGAAASILAQAPLFYQPMVTKIAASYMRPIEQDVQRLVSDATWLGAELDIAASFGVEFLSDLVGEIIAEAGIGWSVTKFIPFVGPLLSGGMDAAIASTLTWRVGVAAAIYYENGLAWSGSGQKATYQTAKEFVGGFNMKSAQRVDLESLRRRVPEVNNSSVKTVIEIAKMFRDFSVPIDQIRRKLIEEKGIDSDIVDAALRDLR